MASGFPILINETDLLLDIQINNSTQASGGFDDNILIGAAVVCGLGIVTQCLIGAAVAI